MIARCAVEEGHAVSLFLAGDAVQLLRDPVLDNVVGLGTGSLRESYDIIVAGGGRFYLSILSSNARGISQADLVGKPAELVMPKVLVQLSLEHDRMFTY
jgi:predicted peroxiredoxin